MFSEICHYLRNRYRWRAMKKERNSSRAPLPVPIGFRQKWLNTNGLYSSSKKLEQIFWQQWTFINCSLRNISKRFSHRHVFRIETHWLFRARVVVWARGVNRSPKTSDLRKNPSPNRTSVGQPIFLGQFRDRKLGLAKLTHFLTLQI